jgi:phosphatidylglycerophosphate synthase
MREVGPHARATVPNAITAVRVGMAALAAWLAAAVHAGEAAVAVCAAAAALDAFDGWYARAFAQRSRVGEHMDPLADKILMGVVYGWVAIEAASALVWTLVVLVAAREAAMTLLRAYSLRRDGRTIPASTMGRVKMLVQSVVGLGILGSAHVARVPVPAGVVSAALAVILVISYASAASYLADWRRAGRREQAWRGSGRSRAAAHP